MGICPRSLGTPGFIPPVCSVLLWIHFSSLHTRVPRDTEVWVEEAQPHHWSHVGGRGKHAGSQGCSCSLHCSQVLQGASYRCWVTQGTETNLTACIHFCLLLESKNQHWTSSCINSTVRTHGDTLCVVFVEQHAHKGWPRTIPLMVIWWLAKGTGITDW